MAGLPLSPDGVVFDLDGTLWDTCAACARGWNAVVQRHRIPFRTVTADDVRQVVGKSHDACIREAFAGLDEDRLQTLIAETAIEDNRRVEREGGELYAGVLEGVKALQRRFPLFIVSNCQSGYIELFLAQSGLRSSFRDFECWGNTGRPKPENLRALIERNGLAGPWFVGDTAGDLEAARANGVPFVHAEYGFGRGLDADLRIGQFGDLVRALGA